MTDLQAFQNHLEARDASPLTIQGYLRDVQAFVVWFEQTHGEACTPEAVTPTDVREYRQHLQAVKRRRANTVNRALAAVRAWLDWAVQAGQITENPARRVRRVKRGRDLVVRWLSRQEQYTLRRTMERELEYARQHHPKRWRNRVRDMALITLLLHAGLRLSEACALRLDDLTLSARKGQVVVRGKGNKERTVPLNAEARRALREWLAVRPAGDYLFCSLEDPSAPLTPRAVQRIVRRVADQAQLPHLTPHVLRHTFAKNLVNAGVSLEKVAALLGHSNLDTTRIYVTPNEQDLQQAVERIAE